MAKNLRRISVQIDLDLTRGSRETNEATLPRYIKSATEEFILSLESVGFTVKEARVRSSLGYLRHEFPATFLRKSKKVRALRRVVN
jgi:Arc/MetJ family transcription regulator